MVLCIDAGDGSKEGRGLKASFMQSKSLPHCIHLYIQSNTTPSHSAHSIQPEYVVQGYGHYDASASASSSVQVRSYKCGCGDQFTCGAGAVAGAGRVHMWCVCEYKYESNGFHRWNCEFECG